MNAAPVSVRNTSAIPSSARTAYAGNRNINPPTTTQGQQQARQRFSGYGMSGGVSTQGGGNKMLFWGAIALAGYFLFVKKV